MNKKYTKNENKEKNKNSWPKNIKFSKFCCVSVPEYSFFLLLI